MVLGTNSNFKTILKKTSKSQKNNKIVITRERERYCARAHSPTTDFPVQATVILNTYTHEYSKQKNFILKIKRAKEGLTRKLLWDRQKHHFFHYQSKKKFKKERTEPTLTCSTKVYLCIIITTLKIRKPERTQLSHTKTSNGKSSHDFENKETKIIHKLSKIHTQKKNGRIYEAIFSSKPNNNINNYV